MDNQKVLSKGLEVIKQFVDDNRIPGACLAFVTKDDACNGSYGYKQLVPERLQVDDDTIYDLASLTKVVSTTTMILSLIEKGKLSLYTELKDIIPEFRFDGITIEHLLTHTSGMYGDDKAYKNCKNKQEMFEFMNNLDLEYETGSKVVYSDFGFIYLGFIIEKLMGGVDKYSKELIYDPLNMTNTMYNPYKFNLEDKCAASEMTQDRGLVKGIVHDGKAFRLDGLSGNAGLFSNTKDLSKFVRMILNDGTLDDKKILEKETVDLLKECFTDGLNDRRTLGWIASGGNAKMGSNYSDTCLFHTGFSGTSIYIDFERECGIILLTNRIHPTRDNQNIFDLRTKVHDVMLETFDK